MPQKSSNAVFLMSFLLFGVPAACATQSAANNPSTTGTSAEVEVAVDAGAEAAATDASDAGDGSVLPPCKVSCCPPNVRVVTDDGSIECCFCMDDDDHDAGRTDAGQERGR
jgi:hypothetical protein